MRKAFFAAVALVLCSTTFASPVSQEQALQKALQFAASRMQSQSAGPMRLAKRQTAVTATTVEEGAAYYVFNLDAGGGFVIVSGDDRTPPILGYSDKGSFDDNSIPDNMKVFLESYVEQMGWLDSLSVYTDGQTQSRRSAPAIKSPVSPLLTTSWNQDNPYNKNIPTLAGNYFVTGCVATAMAQIMNYHGQQTGQPACVMADIPEYQKLFNYQGLKVVNFGGIAKGTAIDWAHMQDVYETNATPHDNEQLAQQDAVANLMYYCGAALEMEYNLGNSTASSYRVPIALTGYFGYDTSTRVIRREDFSNDEWEGFIRAELECHRPVLYSGTSAKLDNYAPAGHAFVVDGFDGEDMFHINWGWGGDCDGYFLLTVAKPADKLGIGAGNSDDGYTREQCAVIGAQPGTGGSAAEQPMQLAVSAVNASGNTVSFQVRNYNTKGGYFEYGIGLLADDGRITEISHSTGNFSASNGFTYSYINASFTVSASQLNANSCKIAVISRERGSGEWLTPMDTDRYYIKAVRTGSDVTLSLVPTPVLSLESVTLNRNTSGKSKQQIEARIKNTGDEFYGEISMTVKCEATGASTTLTQGTFVPAGQTATVPFSFSPQQKGEHSVSISYHDPGEGDKVMGTQTIYAPAKVSNNVTLTVDIKVTNSIGSAILGRKAHVVTTVKNDTDDDYEGLLWPALSSTGSISYSNVTEFVAAHSEAVYDRDYDVVAGTNYVAVCLVQKGGSVNVAYGSTYLAKPGVIIYTSDGGFTAQAAASSVNIPSDAVAVDFSGNSATKSVTPSSNPNCLYYVDANAGIPQGLTANVVRDTRAESLTLSDEGLSFTPIYDFTADTVTFTRHFDKGVTATAGGDGPETHPAWTTVCLPFDVERCVTADGEQVEWMRSESDPRHDFWLMEYRGDENNTLYFAPAATMQAYTPYLIAVPSAGLKGLRDMTGAPVTFCGADATIKADARGSVASSNYKFVGTMAGVTDAEWAYNIDGDGTCCRMGTVSEKPFRAYVKAMAMSAHTDIVPISIGAHIDVEPADGYAAYCDVNGDGAVDVADISTVISVMAETGNEEQVKAADVNGDGTVDVADISTIITIMAR